MEPSLITAWKFLLDSATTNIISSSRHRLGVGMTLAPTCVSLATVEQEFPVGLQTLVADCADRSPLSFRAREAERCFGTDASL
jgi:hypothetical protein